MNNNYIYQLIEQLKEIFASDIKRYYHTLSVANTASCLAMRYNEDTERAYLAGLLHDCAKCMTDEELLIKCRDNNIMISASELKSPQLLHAKYGAYLAQKHYNIEDDEIIAAIEYHTTGRPRMSLLEEIVFVADYIEPLRYKISNMDEIRALAFKDIKAAICTITENTLKYLEDNSRPVDPLTKETHNYYYDIIGQPEKI